MSYIQCSKPGHFRTVPEQASITTWNCSHCARTDAWGRVRMWPTPRKTGRGALHCLPCAIPTLESLSSPGWLTSFMCGASWAFTTQTSTSMGMSSSLTKRQVRPVVTRLCECRVEGCLFPQAGSLSVRQSSLPQGPLGAKEESLSVVAC